MPLIKIDTNRISDLSNIERIIKNKTNDSQNIVRTVVNNLDWEVSSKENINTRLDKAQKKLQTQLELMDSYIKALDTVSDSLSSKDRNFKDMAKDLIYMLNQMNFTSVFTNTTTKVSWKIDEKLNKIISINTFFNLAPIIIPGMNRGVLEIIKRFFDELFARQKEAEARREQERKQAAEAAAKEAAEKAKLAVEEAIKKEKANSLQAKIDELASGKYKPGEKGDSVHRGRGNASACHGFALNFLGELHGIKGWFTPDISRTKEWVQIGINDVQPGDFVRYKYDDAPPPVNNHSIVITKVEGDLIHYIEYAGKAGNKVGVDTMTRAELEEIVARPLSHTYASGGATNEKGYGYISRYNK